MFYPDWAAYIFFLICNFDINKIPVMLSASHWQVFLAWMLIYKHNLSPHNYNIWNNKDILYQQKCIFLENLFQNNIVLRDQLINSDSSFDIYIQKCNISIRTREFATVFGAISSLICVKQKRVNNQLLPCLSPNRCPEDKNVSPVMIILDHPEGCCFETKFNCILE